MTLQQREPFEDLAKEAKPVRKKITLKSTQPDVKDKKFSEKMNRVTEMVRRSFLNNCKFSVIILEQYQF